MTAAVTTEFRTEYARSHVAVAGGSLQDLTGTQVGGALTFDTAATNSVSIDVTAANRRSCSLTLIDVDGILIPVVPNSPLGLVNEISLSRGIRLPDGTVELVALGIFGIQTAVETGNPAGPAITVTGIDRSKRLDVNLSHGISFAAGTTFDVVISGLADASGVTYDKTFDPTVVATTTPALVFNAGDNIWQHLQTAASSIGCWAYFDTSGVLTVVPVPDPDGQPIDWAYEHGAQAMFDQTQRALALEDGSGKAYSHAVILSSVHGSSTPLRSDAFDTNPASPTYYLGPFGDRPIFDTSAGPYVATQAQADAAAAALLRRNYGLLERVTLQAAPNPALTGGDVVLIVDPNTDTNGVYITESFTVPLFAQGGKMSVVARSRQLH